MVLHTSQRLTRLPCGRHVTTRLLAQQPGPLPHPAQFVAIITHAGFSETMGICPLPLSLSLGYLSTFIKFSLKKVCYFNHEKMDNSAKVKNVDCLKGRQRISRDPWRLHAEPEGLDHSQNRGGHLTEGVSSIGCVAFPCPNAEFSQ